MYNRVLLLSASAGAGHLRAADALEKSFKALHAASQVRHVDALEYTNEVFRSLYSKAYIEMVNKAPEALGWMYEKLDKPFGNQHLIRAFHKLNTRPFVKMIREYQPDLIVCTHFLPAEVVSRLKEKGEIQCPQAIVVTDLDMHSMWLCRRYEHYFVALEETKFHLTKLGIPADKITVSGIPIDPIFAMARDRKETARQHDLDPALPTFLISAGGFGVGPVENLLHALFEVGSPIQVIVVCGRNKELKKRMDSAASRASAHVRVKVIGFTSEMDQFMSCSDFLVGKPGGLTTSEALAKGLIMVIVNPIPGQEERNSDHLLEQGVAVRCNHLSNLPFKIDALLANRSRLTSMKRNVKGFAWPDSAGTVTRTLLKLQSTLQMAATGSVKKKKPSFSLRQLGC
jgi:processive 1,2-diacylglycerol beta-glucosyltransferase